MLLKLLDRLARTNAPVLTLPPFSLKTTDVTSNFYVFQLQVSSNVSLLSTTTSELVSVSSLPIPSVTISTSLSSSGSSSQPVSRPFFSVAVVKDPLNTSVIIDMASAMT